MESMVLKSYYTFFGFKVHVHQSGEIDVFNYKINVRYIDT